MRQVLLLGVIGAKAFQINLFRKCEHAAALEMLVQCAGGPCACGRLAFQTEYGFIDGVMYDTYRYAGRLHLRQFFSHKRAQGCFLVINQNTYSKHAARLDYSLCMPVLTCYNLRDVVFLITGEAAAPAAPAGPRRANARARFPLFDMCAWSLDDRYIITTQTCNDAAGRANGAGADDVNSLEQRTKVWDAATGQLLHVMLGHTDQVLSCYRYAVRVVLLRVYIKTCFSL